MTSNSNVNKIRNLYGLGVGELEFLNISPDSDNLSLTIKNQSISFEMITNFLKKQNISSTVVRIPELIDNQLEKLYKSFSDAFTKFNYPSPYKGVFPIKVNHNASVLKSISEYGKKFGHGYEVGTKPELLIVMSLKPNPSSLIICNGAKDVEYLEAILILTEMGYNIIISIESERELDLLISLSNKTNQKPQISLRIKMNQQVEGHWGNSSGLYSKFGLSATELNLIISKLKHYNLLSCVRILHGHLGSQINKVEYFKRSVTELMGYYHYLLDMGAGLRTINLGGGLGIDYEGNEQASSSGITYSFEKYAEVIVSTILTSLKNKPEIIPPNIITESGRAITASSSMLLIEILEKREFLPNPELPEVKFSLSDIEQLKNKILIDTNESSTLHHLNEILDYFSTKVNIIQSNEGFWTDLSNQKGLELLHSVVHNLIIKKTKNIILNNKNGLNNLTKYNALFKLLTTYSVDLVCNFSVFRGVCDILLADQYFPILPTTGLQSNPQTLARIVDITCDSDGEISKFITKSSQNKDSSIDDFFAKDGKLINVPEGSISLNGIPLPSKNINKGNYIAIALTGAYQDTVQFDQNLLGALPEIEVKTGNKNNISIKLIKIAEQNSNLISQMNHDLDSVFKNVSQKVIDKLLYTNPYVNNKSPTILNTKNVLKNKDPYIETNIKNKIERK